MGASIIRVSRRSRRFSCRPRPACPCSDDASCIIPIAPYSIFPSDTNLDFDFGVPLTLVDPTGAGLVVTSDGNPRTISIISVQASTMLRIVVTAGVDVGILTIPIPPGWSGVVGPAGVKVCPTTLTLDVQV